MISLDFCIKTKRIKNSFSLRLCVPAVTVAELLRCSYSLFQGQTGRAGVDQVGLRALMSDFWSAAACCNYPCVFSHIRKWRPIYFSQNVVTQGVSDIRCVFSPFYRMNGALFWHILLQWPRLLTINASKSAQVFSWKPTCRAPFFCFSLLGFMYHINSVTSDYQNSCLVKSGEFILSLCCIF